MEQNTDPNTVQGGVPAQDNPAVVSPAVASPTVASPAVQSSVVASPGPSVQGQQQGPDVPVPAEKEPAGAVDAGRKRKRREIIKAEEEESVAKKFGRYLVPLLAVLVFILLFMFVYIPFGSDALDRREETKGLLEKIEWNESKISDVKGINMTTLDNTIADISEVVRDKMDVAELAAEVEEIALSNDLSPKELTFSDIGGSADLNESQIVYGEWVPGFSSSISGPFAFYGEFVDVVRFINELRNESPTVLYLDLISVSRYKIPDSEEVDEEEDDDRELWSVDIMIYGYTSSLVTEVEITDSVNVDVDQEVLDRIRERMSPDDTENNQEEDGPEQNPEEN